tara:strand:- start:5502 stop:7430 length:1929 start_codon:yes stop_codon:yes gene_type:complete
MGLIKDLLRYPTKAFPIAADTVIGTDSENGGQTVNFSVGTLIGSDNPLLQDNKFKIINIGVFREEDLTNLSTIANAINSLPILLADPNYKIIGADQIPIFVGLAKGGTNPNIKGSEYVSSIVVGYGKGEYGVDGDHILTQDDVFIIESTVVTGVPSYEDDPNANVEVLGDIPDGDYLAIINTASPQYTITAGTNWYFDFTVEGDRFVYGFQGANGNYGLGVSAMVEDDLFLIYDATGDIAIADNQIAVGTSEGLEGDKNFTWDGVTISIDSTDGLSEYTSESINIFDETSNKRMTINKDGFSFLNYTDDTYATLNGSKLEFSDITGNKITISPPNNLTGNSTATLQDKSGILAYLSDFVLQDLQSVLDTGVTAFSDDTGSWITLDPENTMFNVNLTDGVTNANILFVEDSFNVTIGEGSNTGSLNIESDLIGFSKSSNLGEVSFYIGDPKVGGTEISLDTPSTASIGEKFIIPLTINGIKADSNADINLANNFLIYDVSQDVFQHTSTTSTTVKTWSIPANTIKDGDVLIIKGKINRLNGSTGNPLFGVKLDGDSIVNLANSTVIYRHVIVKNGELIRHNVSGAYTEDLDSSSSAIDWDTSVTPDFATTLNIDLNLNFSTINTDEFRLVMFTVERIGTNMAI